VTDSPDQRLEGLVRVGPEPLPVAVRLEGPGEAAPVRAVELAAFPGPEEADIVDRIRSEAPDGWHSLVAADQRGTIVGHLLLSPCPVIDAAGRTVAHVLAVGPMAVAPAVQRRGVGSALTTAAVGLALARAVPALVLLGYPDYYGRFGFEPARRVGLEPPAAAWPDAAWMARLLPAWDDSMAGTVRYPAAFEPLA
jgi:putative acetyltransferase